MNMNMGIEHGNEHMIVIGRANEQEFGRHQCVDLGIHSSCAYEALPIESLEQPSTHTSR